MPADTTTPQETDLNSHSHSKYACPFCEASYDHELLTRVHVTRSDDETHKNHDGFMPETQVAILDEDGAVVETLAGRPDELNTNELTREDLPGEFDQRKERVLLIGAYKPNADFTEIHERATAVLEENDLWPVSYETVRRWIREFYTPQIADSDQEDAQVAEDSRNLDELTPKQQAVVLARLDAPDASYSELAEQAGCSAAYPSSVLDQKSELVEALSARLEDGESLRDIVTEELSAAAIDQLADDALLGPDFFEEELAASLEDHGNEDELSDGPANDSTSRVMSASPDDFSIETDQPDYPETSSDENGEKPESGNSSTNSPVDSAPSTVESAEESTNESATSTETTGLQSSNQNEEQVQTDTVSEEDSSAGISRTEIERIQDRISFFRRIAEAEVAEQENGSTRARTQLVLARELETELEQVLAD
jgi:hypothetical protein